MFAQITETNSYCHAFPSSRDYIMNQNSGVLYSVKVVCDRDNDSSDGENRHGKNVIINYSVHEVTVSLQIKEHLNAIKIPAIKRTM